MAGHAAVARLLLAAGAQASRATTTGETALIFASRAGHVEVVRVLLEGVWIARWECVDIVTTLVQHVPLLQLRLDVFRLTSAAGAAVNAVRSDGTSALHNAAGKVWPTGFVLIL